MSSGAGKQALRAAVLAARRGMSEADRRDASSRIAERLAAMDRFQRCHTLALYAAMGAEVDTSAIARIATERGKTLAFPRFTDGERALHFAACSLPELVPGPHGTRQPPGAAPAVPWADLDVVVVPGVAFDLRGHRLGRGRGHYDATLVLLPSSAARIGLAFELQIVDAVPQEPHDVPLDAIATEARLIPVNGSR